MATQLQLLQRKSDKDEKIINELRLKIRTLDNKEIEFKKKQTELENELSLGKRKTFADTVIRNKLENDLRNLGEDYVRY